MITLISPAKIQNTTQATTVKHHTQPLFIDDVTEIVEQLRSYSIAELAELLQTNSKIAQQNADRFLHWHTPFTLSNAKQAALLYDGEVFRGLDFVSFTDDEMIYAQNHLRILSGLYGILRPLDLVQPYRLEISTKLPNRKGNNMYAYWKDKVTETINRVANQLGKPQVIVNLMSNEFFKTLQTDKINCRIIDVEFLQYQPDKDKFKSIVIYIKKARGLMTRFILQNQFTDPEQLKSFSADGYWYNEERSNENKLVFVR